GGVFSSLACHPHFADESHPRRRRPGMSAEHEQNGLAVSARELTKVYQRGREQIRALDKVTFEVQRGEFVPIVGPSGAGKTTLLNLLGCMDAPSSGTLKLFS